MNLELARNGQTQYAIILNTNSIQTEKMAAQELSDYLAKVTGARFEVLSETNAVLPSAVVDPGYAGGFAEARATMADKSRAIYVGWTDFARKQGLDGSTLGEEEWVIKSYGKNLVLTGGRTRGTLYAVYELLEQQLGCHWLDERTEIIPSLPNLKLGALDIKGKPLFQGRDIYTGVSGLDRKDGWKFGVRNKSTGDIGNPYLGIHYGSPGGCHTFYEYSKDWQTNHPEYLAMNDKGERVRATSGSGPGQICLTNPEARKLMLEKLRQYIIKDRKSAAQNGVPPPRIYAVEQNDSHWICKCPGCKALAEQEGADSGLLMDFINYLADGVREEFPDVLVDTFAYTNTLKAPRTIRPRDNVVIRLAQLNAEWADPGNSNIDNFPDYFRPMTHTVNRTCRENLRNWATLAKHLAIWDYWIQYDPNDKFPTPYVNVWCIKPDLELFLDNHVELIFAECESWETTSFFALKRWVGFKLMQDPRQPLAPLIQTFMAGYYGQASGKMGEYLAYLEQRIAAVQGAEKLSAMREHNRPYLDLEFFITSKRLLDEAERLCGNDKAALLNVRHERIPVDGALCHMWRQLQARLPKGQGMPFDLGAVIDGYKKEQAAVIESWYSPVRQDEPRKRLDEELLYLTNQPPLPDQFKNLPENQVLQILCKPGVVDDPDSCAGKSYCYLGDKPEDFAVLPAFGLYDNRLKKFGPTLDLGKLPPPVDEKFHVYKVGQFNLGPRTILWGHRSWNMNVDLSDAYVNEDGTTNNPNLYDVYVSVKLTGPAYVPGSTKTNSIRIDRVLLIKPETGK